MTSYAFKTLEGKGSEAPMEKYNVLEGEIIKSEENAEILMRGGVEGRRLMSEQIEKTLKGSNVYKIKRRRIFDPDGVAPANCNYFLQTWGPSGFIIFYV